MKNDAGWRLNGKPLESGLLVLGPGSSLIEGDSIKSRADSATSVSDCSFVGGSWRRERSCSTKKASKHHVPKFPISITKSEHLISPYYQHYYFEVFSHNSILKWFQIKWDETYFTEELHLNASNDKKPIQSVHLSLVIRTVLSRNKDHPIAEDEEENTTY